MRARGVRRLLLTRVLPIVLIVPLLLQILLADLLGRDPRLFPPALRQAKNLLIVTAHPDDECLFFSPSILGVLSGNPDTTGGLLVLSTGCLRSPHLTDVLLTPLAGNNYGLGETRKKELRGSCAALGIDPTRCLALDEAEFQDNPKVWWDEDAIISVVKKYVKKWNTDLVSILLLFREVAFTDSHQIITFDSGGISGHINHRAVSAAVRYETTCL